MSEHDYRCAGLQAGFSQLCTCKELRSRDREVGANVRSGTGVLDGTPLVSREPLELQTAEPEWGPTGKPKTCWTCSNAMFSDRGTYCKVFGENILSEVIAAQDCPTYDYTEAEQ